MPLQVELAKDYRRLFIDPILPSATVGAVSGMMPFTGFSPLPSRRTTNPIYGGCAHNLFAIVSWLWTWTYPGTGASGLAAGGVAGILISKHPSLFSIAAGIQCFGLGTSFWCQYIPFPHTQVLICSSDFRCVLVENGTGVGERPTSTQELKYSALAGLFAGALNGALSEYAETPIYIL